MTEANPVVRLNRTKLLLVMAVFLLPFVAAWIAVSLGWHPGTRSHGQAVLPERSVESVAIDMNDGGQWAWRDPDAPRWTLVAFEHGPCGQACIRSLILLRNVRITLNENQDRVRLLYLGQAPEGKAGKVLDQSWQYGADAKAALAEFVPQAAGTVSVLLVEPNGTALVKYPAGFDADGLKKDLHKVLRR